MEVSAPDTIIAGFLIDTDFANFTLQAYLHIWE
jgi:hypothetical protein